MTRVKPIRQPGSSVVQMQIVDWTRVHWAPGADPSSQVEQLDLRAEPDRAQAA